MNRPRYALILALLAMLVAAMLLAACKSSGGGGGEEEPATTMPAGETPTQAPAVERLTPTSEGVTPEAAASPTPKIDWSDLVTADEADEALGEFVTAIAGGNLNSTWETDSGIYLRIEPGAPEDLQEGAEMEGVEGEPVPGIGEGATWFGGVQRPSHIPPQEGPTPTVTLGVLSLRQGDVYFRIMLNLPEVDSSTQLEIAKDLATKALERLP